METKYDVFLSHNRADKPWTERLAGEIEADRSGPPLKVFFDKWDIPPGADVPAELDRGLIESRYIALVLSPAALASDWVALERSSAIYGDPAARQRHILPLLRQDCDLPPTIARLKYIDFRREEDFSASLQELVATLRGHPVSRQRMSESDLHFREDAALLRSHRIIFDRPAFRVPCIWELFLGELLQAVDDTVAAINTGSLYSRSGRMLANASPRNSYHLAQFRDGFRKIETELTLLKRDVIEFEEYFRSVNPEYSHHRNFYAMLMDFSHSMARGAEGHDRENQLRRLVHDMDGIDERRNTILDSVNELLTAIGDTPFPLIERSSDILKRPGFGGADRIAALLS